jgi:hypothetical protein
VSDDLLARIAAVSDPGTSTDAIGDVMNVVESAYERAKELREMFRAAAVEHIEATGQPLRIGDRVWEAKYPAETKNVPEQKRETLRQLVEACNGDLDAVADCVCADPYKPGHARTLLHPDVYRQCFVTTTKARLVEGKPRKVLVQAWEGQR